MRAQRDVLPALTAGEPCVHATWAIAGELSLTTIGVEKTQEEIVIRLALQELNAVGTHTGVPCAELTCELRMTALSQRLFNDEEVVAASVRFDKGNHDASIVPQRSMR